MIYAVVTFFGLVLARGAENCPESLRADNPGALAAKVQTEARTTAGDPCPDKRATGTDRQQSELLELIRYGLKIHLQKMIAKTRRPDEPGLRAKFFQMRAFLALRHALVRVDGRTGDLIVEPELRSRHDGEFATLDPFGPEDLKRMNAMIGARVARANSQFKNDGDKAAGKRLMYDLRRMGSTGYQELVSNDPTLRYVNPDLDIAEASKALRTELEIGRDDLPKLSLDPPYGRGVGLIYATDLAAMSVMDRPGLCGAFNSLLAKARRMRRAVEGINTALVPLSAVRTSGAAFFSWMTLATAAVATAASTATSYIPGADFKRVRLLYGTPFDPYQPTDAMAEIK